MKKICMLTLSIAEAKPDSSRFEINCAHLTNQKTAPIVAFALTKDKIFDSSGNALWDIGKITLLTQQPFESKKTNKKNKVFVVNGPVEFLAEKEITLPQLKDFLEHNKTGYETFERNMDMPFAIVKARNLVSIEEDRTTEKKYRKQRLYVDFDDYHRQEKILNKDYRWIHYWRQIPDDQIWEKQDRMKDLLNEPGKNLYLILRRYYFDNGNKQVWISGMHWI